MSVLGRYRPGAATRNHDVDFGTVESRRAHTSLLNGDWQPAVALAARTGGEREVTDWGSNKPGVPISTLQAWVHHDPTALALTTLGAGQVRAA